MKQDKWYCTGKYDPISLNAILFDNRAPYERLIPSNVAFHRMWYYAYRICFGVLKEMLRILLYYPIRNWFSGYSCYKKIYKGNIVFIAPTVNNKRALDTVYHLVKFKRNNTIFLGKADAYMFFPRVLELLKSIQCCFILYQKIKSLTLSERRIAGFYISNFLLSPGYTWCCRRMLTKYRPECLIMANDHIYSGKALTLLCEDLDIKTIYIQHASVSYAFPELHFSYSFLDGFDSFDKYIAEGKNVYGKAILLGAVRYDKLNDYRYRRGKHYRSCVGIAINKLDDFTVVSDFCAKLLAYNMKIKLKIRAHPSIKHNPLSVHDNRIVFTNARDEDVVAFLDSIDVLISGDSGIHFDALLAGVPTMAFNFTIDEYGDNYKYIEKGMVKLAEGVDDVCLFIGSKSVQKGIDSKIQYYDESFGKKYSGHCAEIIAEFVNSGFNLDLLKENTHLKSIFYKGHEALVIPS